MTITARTQHNKHKILFIGYSQTGQLLNILNKIVTPIKNNGSFEVSFLKIKPLKDFPFPWPPVAFFNVFPESIYQKPITFNIENSDALNNKYDLIILGYQVWFLSPSLPTASFLQSPEAQSIFANTPVITVVACRNMWVQAQEAIKSYLQKLNAIHIDHIALVDKTNFFFSVISTVSWMFSGKKGPFLQGIIPKAGVSEEDVVACNRFGMAIVDAFSLSEKVNSSILSGLQAAEVNEQLLISEKMAYRSFRLWGKIIINAGKFGKFLRLFFLALYFIFLAVMIFTIVPVNMIVQRLTFPLSQKRLKKLKAFYELPSGSEYNRRKTYEQ